MNELNGKSKWFKEEIKFIFLVAAFIASALFNWFSTKSDVALLKYRVDKVEQARAEVWAKQDKINQEQLTILNELKVNVGILLKR